MAQIYLSGPAIASLRASARMTENKLMRAGRYGPVLRHDHVAFVAVEAIERRIGEPITPERLALADAGKPNRMLVAAPQEDRLHFRNGRYDAARGHAGLGRQECASRRSAPPATDRIG